MSNQTSFIESKNSIMENQNPKIMSDSFSLSPELKDEKIKIISQDKEAKDQKEMDRLYERKIEASKEAYRLARELGTYDYYRFARDFPDELDELDEQVKCPTCEEMIYTDDNRGMCYTCFDIEQQLYPDDIPMELRYKN